jgi:hypothetical protein
MPIASSNQAEYKYLPTDKLRFDPGNPRFFGSKRPGKRGGQGNGDILNFGKYGEA